MDTGYTPSQAREKISQLREYVTELARTLEQLCPTCNGSMEPGDYREYGYCYSCRLAEWEERQ